MNSHLLPTVNVNFDFFERCFINLLTVFIGYLKPWEQNITSYRLKIRKSTEMPRDAIERWFYELQTFESYFNVSINLQMKLKGDSSPPVGRYPVYRERYLYIVEKQKNNWTSHVQTTSYPSSMKISDELNAEPDDAPFL